MTVTIYHNPRCSKSRATLELLQSHGIEPDIIRYLENPPDADTLKGLLAMLGRSARELLRRGEAEYRELGLDAPELDEAAIIAAMVSHPKLIERPIVVANGKAAIGRPPESVLEIL